MTRDEYAGALKWLYEKAKESGDLRFMFELLEAGRALGLEGLSNDYFCDKEDRNEQA